MKTFIKNQKKPVHAVSYARINIALLLLIVFTFLAYIGLVQYTSAAEYRLGVFKRKADQLSIEVASYQRNVDLASSPAILQTFAISHGLVPARDSVMIYPQKNVALGQ